MIINKGSFRATVEAEHRDKDCETCGAITVKSVCPKCGGKGRLIAKSVSIQAPAPPQCVRIRCLWRFGCEVILCGLLTIYHKKRFQYAQKNRYKKIPQNYRSGENSPANIRQTIFAIIKLKIRR